MKARPVLDTARLSFVNFHAGKLPFYRGRNVINWAIINGETEIGLTAHVVDEGIDTGDIVLQKTLPIGWTDTYGDVLTRIVDNFPDFVSRANSSFLVQTFPSTSPFGFNGRFFYGRLSYQF